MIYLIIGVYLAITLAAGFIGYHKAKNTPEDYFLGSRGFGALIMFFTFIATNFSAFFFLGFAGEGYRVGYSYYAMMAFGTALAGLAFFFIGTKVWKLGQKHKYITAPELVGKETGSKPLQVIYVLVMVFFTLPYMAVQPIGAGIIISELTGGQIPYFAGCAILMFFIVIYVLIGGMRSIAVTDMIQGILMFTLIFAAVFLIADGFGGVAEANRKVYELKPELFSREGADGSFTPQRWFSLMLLWLFCVPMFPQMFMRFFISRDLPTLKLSAVLYSIVPVILFIAPVMIGVFGHLVYPDLLSENASPKIADQILPRILTNPDFASPAFAAVIMTGALAAFMSTLDSQLLALSTILSRDVYDDLILGGSKEKNFKSQVIFGRVIVIILAIIALLIAWFRPSSIFVIIQMAFSGLAILFPATVAILHFKRVNPWSCILSIVLGELLFLALFFEWIPRAAILGFEPFIPVIVFSFLVIILGNLLLPKPKVA
ncbi:MAG: sodium:solute symporter family protein [Bacteroidota bacterium]